MPQTPPVKLAPPAWTDDFTTPGYAADSAALANLFIDKVNALSGIVEQSQAFKDDPNYRGDIHRICRFNLDGSVNTSSGAISIANSERPYANPFLPDYPGYLPTFQGFWVQQLQAIVDEPSAVFNDGVVTSDVPGGYWMYVSPGGSAGYGRDAFRTAAQIDVTAGWRRRRAREIFFLDQAFDLWGNAAVDGQVARLQGASSQFPPLGIDPIVNLGVACYAYRYTKNPPGGDPYPGSYPKWVLQPPGTAWPDVLDTADGTMCGGVVMDADYLSGHVLNQLRDAIQLLINGSPAQTLYSGSTTPPRCIPDPRYTPPGGTPTPSPTPTPPSTPITACGSCAPCCFQIGDGGTWTPPCDGTLGLYYNDAVGAYADNTGQFTLTTVVTGEAVGGATVRGAVGPGNPTAVVGSVVGGKAIQFGPVYGIVDNGGRGPSHFMGGPKGAAGSANHCTACPCPAANYAALVAVFTPATPTPPCLPTGPHQNGPADGVGFVPAAGDSRMTTRCRLYERTGVQLSSADTSGTFTTAADGYQYAWANVSHSPPPAASIAGGGCGCGSDAGWITITRTA